MIVPILKGLHSADLVRPETPKASEFAVAMQASIGPKDENGAETFSFTVATPAFVASLGLPRWGRGLLLVQSFSWQEVERHVERLLARAHRATWAETAAVLNQQMEWEFDGYQRR
jgi:Immunity protein 8